MRKRPEEALADMDANLLTTTGKALPEWLEIIRAKGLTRHGEVMAFLKGEMGITHGFATRITRHATAKDDGDVEVIDKLFEGKKASTRPIYDAVLAQIRAFGDDVDLAPKIGYMSVRRTVQFAILQPSTTGRLDLGLKLKGVDPFGRLEASGSWNTMLTHRVRVTSLEEIDDQLIGWLSQAYQAA